MFDKASERLLSERTLGRAAVWPWSIELARSFRAHRASELLFLGAEFLLGGAS